MKGYSDEDCTAAIHGQNVPEALGLHVTQLCVLRGIRHFHGFATELRGVADYPEFTRALNAREIMSNVIPNMVDPQEFPYCIWYPDVAEEHTYRALFHRHPQMRYHVGRACAVAGYTKLYGELGLLPDLSIAEEARDNKQNRNSKQILDDIMSQPLRWAVMNDYARSVNVVDPSPAEHGLNADTAVVSTLGSQWVQWRMIRSMNDLSIRSMGIRPHGP